METVAELLGRAEELLDRGEERAVVALLEPVKDGGNSEVLYTLGLACYRLEKYQEAIEHLNLALSLKPNYILALARRGLAYQELGQQQAATADFEQTLTFEPQDHHDWRGRGIALCELKKYEEAIASYDKAIEIKPDYHEAWYGRGNALGKLGRYEEAIASYDKAIEIKPDYHEAWFNRGYTLVNLGRHKEAIAAYDKAIEIKPDYYKAWHNRGAVLGDSGRDKEAIPYYKKALEFRPDLDQAWDNFRKLAASQLLSLQDWLHLQQICEAGLQRIAFEQEPMRHLTIWKYYLWVCSRTRSPKEVDQLAQEAGSKFSRYLAQNTMSEWKEQRLREQFAGFKHLEVSTLAQAGKLEEALQLAEKHRNFRMGSLIDGQGYRATATTFQQAQQLLTPDTAIIYWHYSPIGFTTFVLRHGQPLQLLHPPATKPQGNVMGLQGNQAIFEQLQKFEQWLQGWQQNYAEYNKLSPDGEIAKNEHPWQKQMQENALSLKSILNIPYLIKEYLGKIKNLILIPHRDLHLLPLHSLFPFQFTTTYLPSLQVGLNLQTLAPQTPSPLLNIHQPTGSPYIEIAQTLITAIHDQLPLESHSLPSLNKEQFLALLGKRHRALQFTGHGSYNSAAPEQSAIQLPDGEFQLLDFRQHPHLDLSSYQFLCLTACESGITTQSLLDEYVGWSSAFLAKKARAVISTLWNVDIRASALLMIKFHEIFNEEIFNEMPPKSAPIALREAQSWMSLVEYAALADWYTKLADATNIQHGAYLRTEADKFRNEGAKNADSNDIKDIRPFWNPYHWAGFICTGLLEQ